MVTPEGRTIGVVQDYTRASETHTRAVDEYLRPVFEGWVYENAIGGAYGQVRSFVLEHDWRLLIYFECTLLRDVV